MKKYLIPNEGKFYKANLHMHTTISDGNMTIEETKEKYMEQGYSIVAFTDHEIMVPHPELTDENFLAITSTEVSVNTRYDCDFRYNKCYHLNFYSKEPNRDYFKAFTKARMWLKQSFQYISKNQEEYEFDKIYDVDNVNEVIALANSEGMLVSYNHPVWSLQNYSDYIGLKGLWGVEWYNTGCARDGFIDTMQPIDDLLRKGEKVYPLATDDAHGLYSCFKGFVMVKAKSLDYDVVFKALKDGDFYSSTGPLIDELYVEDGILHIKTSDVKKIFVTTDRRMTRFINTGELVNEETLDLNEYISTCNKDLSNNFYIRVSLIDAEGNEAHTRAYYLDELI